VHFANLCSQLRNSLHVRFQAHDNTVLEGNVDENIVNTLSKVGRTKVLTVLTHQDKVEFMKYFAEESKKR
jgi:hypothetical protein